MADVTPDPQVRMERFKREYTEELSLDMLENPDKFMPGRDALTVANKMFAHIEKSGIRSVGISGSRSFRRCAKAFGIKNTYKDWEAWLAGK